MYVCGSVTSAAVFITGMAFQQEQFPFRPIELNGMYVCMCVLISDMVFRYQMRTIDPIVLLSPDSL